MEPRTPGLHACRLTAAILGQTLFLAAAWGFIAAVFQNDPLIPSESFAVLMSAWGAETTWIVTLIATVASIASATFLAIAIKEALKHRIHRPIPLIYLSGGIVLAKGSFLINVRHWIPTLVTLAVFTMTKLLVSSWATLLTPVLVNWTVDASGWELDLTSGPFESMLQQELIRSGAALVRGNSTEILNLDGVLSGIAAAQYSFGSPGIFNFNGVKYNVSTGGILPAVPEYSGITEPVSINNTGLGFIGGLVPTHLNVNFPKGRTTQGLEYSFALQQQGLTANVTCQQVNGTQPYLSSSFYPVSVPLAADYWLWAWNITSDCGEGLLSQQQYVTQSNSSTVLQGYSNGFLYSLVCPYPLGQTGFIWDQFTVVSNGTGRYDFLPLTVCTINPLITTSLVSYSSSIINTTVISSRSLGSSNTNLTRFLAALVDYQAWYTQGLTTNDIGDALYAIYISASVNSSDSSDEVINLVLRELELYWRGVIEFSGTFLRSAFSVYPRIIPTDARIPLYGNETIVTMGWHRRSVMWECVIIPITVVALLLYAAVAYTLWHIFIKRDHEPFNKFDPSNPIHMMMVSSTKDDMVKDHLDDRFAGFEHGGVGKNEDLSVQLVNVGLNRKRFKVSDGQPLGDIGVRDSGLVQTTSCV